MSYGLGQTDAVKGTRNDPIWRGARQAADLVLRASWPGSSKGRLERVQRALAKVRPGSGTRFAEVLARPTAKIQNSGQLAVERLRRELCPPSRAVVRQAAAVALANSVLDHYMGLGIKALESRGDPRIRSSMARAGLGQLTLDFSGRRRRPYYDRYRYRDPSRVTQGDPRVGAVLLVAVLAVVTYAIYKAPRSAWRRAPYYYEPGLTLRFNKRRRRRRVE